LIGRKADYASERSSSESGFPLIKIKCNNRSSTVRARLP